MISRFVWKAADHDIVSPEIIQPWHSEWLLKGNLVFSNSVGDKAWIRNQVRKIISKVPTSTQIGTYVTRYLLKHKPYMQQSYREFHPLARYSGRMWCWVRIIVTLRRKGYSIPHLSQLLIFGEKPCLGPQESWCQGCKRELKQCFWAQFWFSHMLMIPKWCDISFRVHKESHCHGNWSVIPEVLL